MKKLSVVYFILLFCFIACDKSNCPYADERLCDRAYRDSLGAEGCEDVEDPFASDTGIVSGNSVCYDAEVFLNNQKTVLLEDFTGFRCTNCLPAAITADNLQDQWCDRLVVVAYHVYQQFAAPIAEPPEPFSTDFRTDDGENLAIEFQVPSLPNGMIDRENFGTGQLQQAGSWSDFTGERMNEDPTGFVRFRDVELSSDMSDLSFKVAARMFGEVEGTFNLVVGVYENGLIEGQKNDGETIFPYTHDHVFRGNINGLYGQEVFTPASEFDENCADLFEFTSPLDSEWDLNNCYLFAYLVNQSTLEVVQVTKTAIVQ